MKNFGKVESYDNSAGTGLISPENGEGKSLPFERSAFSWTDKAAPPVGRRLSYDIVEKDGVKHATKLEQA